ncbi:hypothetical protein BJ742DRAFT_829696 [Cladochytrium replicatum]|nr:hypothetical protein BJ742DRAFT_829696 [Cladochytrium replicatum]
MGTKRQKKKPHPKTAKNAAAALENSMEFIAAVVAEVEDKKIVKIAADSSTTLASRSTVNSRETLPVLQETGPLPGAVISSIRAPSAILSISSATLTSIVPPSSTTRTTSSTTTTTITTTTTSAAIITSITTTSPQSSTTTTEHLALVSLDIPPPTSSESPAHSIAGFGPSFPTLPASTTTSSVDAEQNGRGLLTNSGQLAGFISIGVAAVAVVLIVAFFAVWSKKHPAVPASARTRPMSISEKSLLRRSSPSEMTGTSSSYVARGYTPVNYVANPTPPGLVWTDSIAFVPITFPAFTRTPDSASASAYAIPYPVQLAPAPIPMPTASWPPQPPNSANRTPNRSAQRLYDRMSVEVIPKASSVETNSTSHIRNDSNQTSSLSPLAEYANHAPTRYPSIYTSAGRTPRTLAQQSSGETARSGEARQNRVSVIRSEERLNQQRSAVSSPRLSFYYQDDSPRATKVSTGDQESITPRRRSADDDVDEVSSYWSSLSRSTLDRTGRDSFGRNGDGAGSPYWSSMPRGGRGSTATRSTEETDDSFDSRRRSGAPKDDEW